ncbi:MAG TPA: glycosyltransferase family 39 protein [Candidatus Hydrogenedentes bacterium]|mgnify:FL=1|jgi:4-amino-4-deoxy-L-arabinose transferase-like glycosyltransferase|nr:glycosyltransferase family 39 protein [Candidatus Hydrogenedentota bacterium]
MSDLWIKSAAVLLLAAIIFSVNVSGYDLWPPDEPRYALVAREMLSTGDYFLPKVNNEGYKEKPPLFFWCIAACAKLTGSVGPLSARMPSILAALTVLIFTTLLARALFSDRIAFWSLLILMTTQRFWWNARFGQIDMLLTACLTAGLYMYWRWEKTGRKGWILLFYLFMTAGLFSKGPGVLVFPVLFVLTRTWRSPHRMRHWIGLAAGCSFCVLLYALWAVPAHLAFAQEAGSDAGTVLGSNLVRQTLGRFFLGVSHANWPWYYLTTLPVDWLPWTLFLPWIIYWVWTHRKDTPAISFLLSWTLPAFIFFTIAIGKRGVYLLPLFPAWAPFFAAGILDFMDKAVIHWRRRLGWIYGIALILLGLAPAALLFTEHRNSWSPGLLPISLAAFVCTATLIPLSGKNKLSFLPQQIAGSFLLIYLLTAILILPVINQHKSARFFCTPIAELADKGVDFDLFSVGFAREEYIFYSRHFFKELHTEAIPLQAREDLSPMQSLKLQKKLARALVKKAGKVPVQDMGKIRPDELERLQEAVRQALDQEDCPIQLAEEFKEGLEKENAILFDAFDSPKPAFLYVQDEDWRWIYAIHPDVRNAVMLSQANVGSRHVLLFANPAGAHLFYALN